MSSFEPSAVTQPFFEIQILDFTKKFIRTVPTTLEQKKIISGVTRGEVVRAIEEIFLNFYIVFLFTFIIFCNFYVVQLKVWTLIIALVYSFYYLAVLG